METELIKSKVNEILVDKLFIDEEMVKDDARLVEDLGCDSLDRFEIIIELEKVFDITISDERAARCVTISDVYGMLDELLLFV